MTIRGRFAPTPSGPLHLGNMLVALLAWLQVRSQGGSFILRLEDIDRPRSKPEWTRLIYEDMRWLGLNWDEGPEHEGPYGPYVQSERTASYEGACRTLQESGWTYPCYCSRADLAAIASAPHHGLFDGSMYPGSCRTLNTSVRAERARTKTPSLRFRMEEAGPIEFSDAVFGTLKYPAGTGGDFIIQRADRIFAYQLAVVVDDAAMAVTHVLRGADLLDSTARQIALYRALDLPIPSFTHIPLLCGPDGARLAKRHRSLSIAAIRSAGVAPESVIGQLAASAGLLKRPEPVQAADLIKHYSEACIPRHPIVLSEQTLRSLEGHG